VAQILDAPSIVRAMALYAQALERFRPEIDSLNVFPVPDGDTGTNLLHTQRAVAEALAPASADAGGGRAMTGVRETVAQAALSGARGNSGVILSQVLQNVLQPCPTREARRRRERPVRRGRRGTSREPREGTVLTVLDAAGRRRPACGADPAAAAGTVLEAALAGARAALVRTTDQPGAARGRRGRGWGPFCCWTLAGCGRDGRALTEPPGPAGPVGRRRRRRRSPKELAFPFEVEFVLEGAPDPHVELASTETCRHGRLAGDRGRRRSVPRARAHRSSRGRPGGGARRRHRPRCGGRVAGFAGGRV
jgi:hypothetical protein